MDHSRGWKVNVYIALYAVVVCIKRNQWGALLRDLVYGVRVTKGAVLYWHIQAWLVSSHPGVVCETQRWEVSGAPLCVPKNAAKIEMSTEGTETHIKCGHPAGPKIPMKIPDLFETLSFFLKSLSHVGKCPITPTWSQLCLKCLQFFQPHI